MIGRKVKFKVATESTGEDAQILTGIVLDAYTAVVKTPLGGNCSIRYYVVKELNEDSLYDIPFSKIVQVIID